MTITQVANKVEGAPDMKFEFIVLPVADPDRALAKFDKGVLTLTVPKQERPRTASRTIEIG